MITATTMNNRDYILNMFEGLGFRLNENQLLGLGIELDDALEIDTVNIAVTVNLIPYLLLSPTTVKEDEFSFSRDFKGLIAFYRMMCNRYGIKNEVDVVPKLRFL